MKKLIDLKPGEEAIIRKINFEGKLKNRLLELGIIENVKIKLIKFAPLGDPLQISIRGYNLAIRKTTAKYILVDKLSTEWRKQWYLL